jgi:DNA polymerase-4
MPRKIIHLDLDAFFCAVEEKRNQHLRSRPFAVGGQPNERGVVASCSYAARVYGVRSAMPMAQAVRLCPQLLIVRPDHAVYQRQSEFVMQRLFKLTSLVEQISIDEAFLDVTDLPEPVEQIARQLQTEIRHELELPCSLGAASNKLVAKIANDVGKSKNKSANPPNAITVVPPGEEAAFLAGLPVIALWGVGPKTAERLNELGIFTIHDLTAWTEAELRRQFGKNGYFIYLHARGLDDSPVITSHQSKSFSQEVTYTHDINDAKVLRQTLRQQAESLGSHLRQEGLLGKTVKLKLRWADFTTFTRQKTLSQITDQDDEIFMAADQLFTKNWPAFKPVRLIGLGITGLESSARQLNLWDTLSERSQKLSQAMDELTKKFGSHAIQRGLPARQKK